MSYGYSKTPLLMKGALVQFSAQMLLPIPNVILFQYNPTTLTRTLDPFITDGGKGENRPKPEGPGASDRSQPHDPPETINITLELDAADALEDPTYHPIAEISGVADRLAALEMMLYADPSASASLSVPVSTSLGRAGGGDQSQDLTRMEVPLALFVWGPGRIVPVRITQFAVEEQAFNSLLYPIRAKVSLAMRILTDDAIHDAKSDHSLSTMDKLAIAAYQFTKKQKQVLALANLANSVESVIGMLPL